MDNFENIEELSNEINKQLELGRCIKDLKNVFRKDENTPSLESQAALRNAPEQENGYFKVPKII